MPTFLRPRPFFIAAAVHQPLVLPSTQVFGEVPSGAEMRLDYILINYPRTVVAGAQTSPDLSFMLFDSAGQALTNRPAPFSLITTPAGGPKIWGVAKWNLHYPPKSLIRMEITGMNSGPVPSNISVTYFGMKDWEAR